jgi:hypothetical protein
MSSQQIGEARRAKRPPAVPDDVADPAVVKATGRVTLPTRVRWSAPARSYDPRSPASGHGCTSGYSSRASRNTHDLDPFIGHADVEADTTATMAAAVERALSEAGIESRREVTTDTLARLTVETELEECRIDLAVDVRMRPVEQDARVALLSLEESSLPTRCSRCSVEPPPGITRTWRRCAGTSAGRSCSLLRAAAERS